MNKTGLGLLSLLLGALSLPASAAPAPGRNVRVNDPRLDEVGHTHGSPSVAVRGAQVLVGFDDAAENRSGYAFSTDAGATFTQRRLPAQPNIFFGGSPSVAFGPGNDAYYAGVMYVSGGTIQTIGVSRSTDGGATFPNLTDAAFWVESDQALQETPSLAADAGASSKFRGWVYVAWHYQDAYGYDVILFSRSSDGLTFDPPVLLSPSDGVGVRSPVVAVAPNGDVLVAYEDAHASPTGITITKSVDGGFRFSTLKVIATYNPLSRLTGGGGAVVTGTPVLGADSSGRVHLAWAATSPGATTDRADILYTRSTDGGVNFAAPRRLNDDSTPTSQAFPALAVAPDGTLAVTWTDRRADPGLDASTGISMAISRDGGASFAPSFRLSDAAWPLGPVERDLPQGWHGARNGLAADGTGFFAAWTDERGDSPDVWFTSVPLSWTGTGPEFTVTPASAWLAVSAGASAGIDVATSPLAGFTGNVTLEATPAVEGLSFAFSPASVAAGGTSRLVVTAAPSVAAGDRKITVTGTSGTVVRSTSFLLTTFAAARGVEPPRNLTSTRGFTAGGGVRADGAGRLHLVTEDDSAAVLAQDVFYRRSTDAGATFSAPRKLNADGSSATRSILAADAAGRVVAAWAGVAAGDSVSRIWVSRSSDAGLTFSAPVAVSLTTQSATFPAVSLSPAGDVLVAYYDVALDPPSLCVTRSTAASTSFDAPSAIGDTAVAAVTRPGLAHAPSGAAFLSYTAQALSVQTGQIVSLARAVVAKDGRAFGTPTSLTSTAGGYSYGPDVAVDAAGNAVAAFYIRTVNADGYYVRQVVVCTSADQGTSWGSPKYLTSGDGNGRFPSVAFEPSGAITVAWEDDRGNPQSDIFLARSTDGAKTFTAPVNLSATPGLSGSGANPFEGVGGSGRAAVSPGPDGTLWVSWTDDSPANTDVFLAAVQPARFFNPPPAPFFTFSPARPAPGEAVSFTDATQGSVTSWSWSFGDGETSSSRNPTHAYRAAGTYRPTLTVTGPGGTASLPKEIVVVGPAPGGMRLSSGRVDVSATYRNPYTGASGDCIPLPQGDAFGYFSIFDRANPEIFVKVLDFGASRPFLLFWGGLTDFEYTLTFRNVATGASVSFTKPAASFTGGFDTTSLPQGTAGTAGAAGAALFHPDGTATALPARSGFVTPAGTWPSAPGPDAADELLLSSASVGVKTTWRSPYDGSSGTAIPIPQGDAFGYFAFTDVQNPEVFVKVLDFGAARPYLLFWAGLTDFQYTVTFRNVRTSQSVSHDKPAGSREGGADTTSLPH